MNARVPGRTALVAREEAILEATKREANMLMDGLRNKRLRMQDETGRGKLQAEGT